LTYFIKTVLPARRGFLSSSGVLLDNLSLAPDLAQSIADAISAGNAAAVSDGSFDAGLQRGTLAFVLAPSVDSPLTSCVSGGNRTTGLPKEQSAYRSKLASALAVLSTVDLLVSHFGISSGAVTIAFDGKAALVAASNQSGCASLSVLRPCFDYLQVIHRHLAALPIDVH